MAMLGYPHQETASQVVEIALRAVLKAMTSGPGVVEAKT